MDSTLVPFDRFSARRAVVRESDGEERRLVEQRGLTDREVAHRRRMLEHLASRLPPSPRSGFGEPGKPAPTTRF